MLLRPRIFFFSVFTLKNFRLFQILGHFKGKIFLLFLYRISPPGVAMQFTLKCDYRSHIPRANGGQTGIYPMLIFSKYRIDDKRPTGPNGEERKPWSKSFFRLQKLFYKHPRNSLLKL